MSHDRLLAMLVDDEAVRLRVYDDATGEPIVPGSVVKGHPTIGIGRALDTNGITRAEAFYLLMNSFKEASSNLSRALPWTEKLDSVRRDVLICMSYNLGLGGLLKFRKMLAACESGDFKRASEEILSPTYIKQVKSRAFKLAEMMMTGRYP